MQPHRARGGHAAADRAREAHSLRLFRQIVGAIRAHYRQIEQRTGTAAAEIRLLDAIARHDGAGIGEIAASLSLHKSTVSNLIGQLVRKRLATRTRAADNQRQVVVRVTAAGRALVRRAPRPAGGLLQQLLGQLTPEELAEVERVLALLVAKLPGDLRRFRGESLAATARGAAPDGG